MMVSSWSIFRSIWFAFGRKKTEGPLSVSESLLKSKRECQGKEPVDMPFPVEQLHFKREICSGRFALKGFWYQYISLNMKSSRTNGAIDLKCHNIFPGRQLGIASKTSCYFSFRVCVIVHESLTLFPLVPSDHPSRPILYQKADTNRSFTLAKVTQVKLQQSPDTGEFRMHSSIL